MYRLAPRFRSPIHQALWSTALVAVLGLAVRFIWGAYDPEMRRWTFVALAPLIGLLSYLQSTGRHRLISVGLVGLGIGGSLFWTAILLSGRMPVTSRADYGYITLILAFPIACIGLGWWQLRKQAVSPETSNSP